MEVPILHWEREDMCLTCWGQWDHWCPTSSSQWVPAAVGGKSHCHQKSRGRVYVRDFSFQSPAEIWSTMTWLWCLWWKMHSILNSFTSCLRFYLPVFRTAAFQVTQFMSITWSWYVAHFMSETWSWYAVKTLETGLKILTIIVFWMVKNVQAWYYISKGMIRFVAREREEEEERERMNN